MTQIKRLMNVAVPPPVRYFIVKVFEPAVRVSMRMAIDALMVTLPAEPPRDKRLASFAASVVAPLMAKLAFIPLAVEFDSSVLMMTRALVPVVSVTAGPAVARSV